MEATETTEITQDTRSTEEVLLGMLKENTGRHMLDSGGAYGRMWERNQTRDLAAEPETRIKFSRYGRTKEYSEISVTHSTYHFLRNNLRFSPEWQAKFDAYVSANDADGSKSWLALMDAFMESVDAWSPFDSRKSNPLTVNTYNHESLLDQTLQYIVGKVEDEESGWEETVVLLQIHGGCDVRGGYTAPKAFILDGNDEYGFFNDTQFYVGCSECDEGRWYNDGGSRTSNDYGHKPLEDYHIVPHGEETDLGPATITLTAPVKGMIYVDENGIGHCPCCGKGTLDAGTF